MERTNVGCYVTSSSRSAIVSRKRWIPNHIEHRWRREKYPRRISALESNTWIDGPSLGTVSLVPILGLMAWKASTYFKMQYITAAMISNHVPRDEARIAELGIGTGKNLYYYPDGTILVYGIDEDANPGLLERTSIAAGVPVQAVAASAYQTGLRDASVDAVVSTGAMGVSGNMRGCVLESLRILKPGRPLIFVESMSGPAKEIPDIVRSEGGFQRVEIDEEWERSRWAPHAVGVAWKQEEVFSPASDNARRVEKVEKAIGKGGRKKRR